MAMTWCIFIILAMLFFREPDIKGPAIYYANKELRNKNLVATWLCAWNIFLTALILETTISSAPLVAPVLDWNDSEIAMYISILNVLLLPVNFVVGFASHCIKDRIFLMISYSVGTAACIILIMWNNTLNEP